MQRRGSVKQKFSYATILNPLYILCFASDGSVKDAKVAKSSLFNKFRYLTPCEIINIRSYSHTSLPSTTLHGSMCRQVFWTCQRIPINCNSGYISDQHRPPEESPMLRGKHYWKSCFLYLLIIAAKPPLQMTLFACCVGSYGAYRASKIVLLK